MVRYLPYFSVVFLASKHLILGHITSLKLRSSSFFWCPQAKPASFLGFVSCFKSTMEPWFIFPWNLSYQFTCNIFISIQWSSSQILFRNFGALFQAGFRNHHHHHQQQHQQLRLWCARGTTGMPRPAQRSRRSRPVSWIACEPWVGMVGMVGMIGWKHPFLFPDDPDVSIWARNFYELGWT